MTRIEQARRRVTLTRYAIGIGSAVALAAFAAVARASHPGTHSAASVRPTATRTSSYEDSTFFGDDDSDSYSNIGPSGSAAPQVQSGAS